LGHTPVRIPRLLVILLAFIGGWVDVATFVGLDHLMAAHITGNIVLLAADLQNGFGETDLVKVIAIPTFFVAVIVFTLIHDRHVVRASSREARMPWIFLIEALLLFVAGGLAALTTDGAGPVRFGLAVAISIPAVVAMACQNAAHRLYPSLGPATTVMTGNIAQFFIDGTRWLRPSAAVPKGEVMPAGERSLPILILAFVLGCGGSAFLTGAIGPMSLLVPVPLLIAMAFWHRGSLAHT
jgi:uncharacterized membrane protein YoaK (UPF0700 family)